MAQSSRIVINLKTVMDAKAADGVGNAIDVRDCRHVILQVGTASTANLTLKFQGSLSETTPDFSAAATVANHWDYIEAYDQQSSATAIAGDTGIAYAAADDIQNIIINTDGLTFVSCIISSYVAGTVTVKGRTFTQ